MTSSPALSLLDLAPRNAQDPPGQAFSDAVRLAQAAEASGLDAVYYAEHHNMATIASSATSVLMGHVADHTSSIKVGAAGVMLPNHAPLVIAEQYGTLEAMHPGRIRLGLGRAPGTDPNTLRALRRSPNDAEHFPQDVTELLGYLAGESSIPGVSAYPGNASHVPVTILGSSLFGAHLAAQLGLSYAFASHFAPAALRDAAHVYLDEFRPSEYLDAPHLAIGVGVGVAETQDEAEERFRLVGRDRVRQMLSRGNHTFTEEELDLVMDHPTGRQILQMLDFSIVGTAASVPAQLAALAEEYGAHELITVTHAPDAAGRVDSVQRLGKAWSQWQDQEQN
ncbi:MAG: LLM class flavin-dependent oxidoreductase [Galactobacter sp.]|uniref:LLM class flavin-dependent oxidoreductase n=1 Tax=Galactobacter sp. TaxID=2676125 RepID=UPI0025C41016|nr:LLM class flavin-dependent oxidoreductase [Galactobacter sp.]